jgi:hypothetical protein
MKSDDSNELAQVNRVVTAGGGIALTISEYRVLIEQLRNAAKAHDATLVIDSMSREYRDKVAVESPLLTGNRHERRKNAKLNRRR